MTDKEQRSITLDPENDAYLAEQHNASAIINDLVTQLREGGDAETAALDLQIEQKERELTEAKQRVSRLEQGLAELRSLRSAVSEQERAELAEARDELSDTPRDSTNPAIQNWAEKLGLRPAELVEELDAQQ